MVKKRSSSPKEGIKGNSAVFGFFRRSFKYVSWLLFILLGGLLFNLDRVGNFGIELLKHKEILPYSLRSFLPGGTAKNARAEKNEILIGDAIEVYDGDTVTLLTGDKKYRIRLYGIDAPEAKQEHGYISRDALREKILGKEVKVRVKNVDRYGRAVGKILIGGRDINLEMVREGHAWYYQTYARDEYELDSAQRHARKNGLGLWKNKSPQPPWKYRASLRSKKSQKSR